MLVQEPEPDVRPFYTAPALLLTEVSCVVISSPDVLEPLSFVHTTPPCGIANKPSRTFQELLLLLYVIAVHLTYVVNIVAFIHKTWWPFISMT